MGKFLLGFIVAIIVVLFIVARCVGALVYAAPPRAPRQFSSTPCRCAAWALAISRPTSAAGTTFCVPAGRSRNWTSPSVSYLNNSARLIEIPHQEVSTNHDQDES